MLRIINSDDQNVYSVKWLKTETGPTKKKDDSKLYYIAIYLDLSNYDCNKPADDQTNGLHKDLLVLIDEPFSSFQNEMDEMVDLVRFLKNKRGLVPLFCIVKIITYYIYLFLNLIKLFIQKGDI